VVLFITSEVVTIVFCLVTSLRGKIAELLWIPTAARHIGRKSNTPFNRWWGKLATSPMRTITNDYRDAKIMDLGSASEKGPYLVTQTGVAPNEPASRTRMFVLRPDGQWADFNAYACQDKPEAIDELIFPTINDVLAIFNTLRGRPRVLDLPIDKDGLKAWLERHKDGNQVQAAHTWAIGYRARRREKRKK
jgi:hypothetical protein